MKLRRWVPFAVGYILGAVVAFFGTRAAIDLMARQQQSPAAPHHKHHRGHKAASPEVQAARHAAAFRRHGHRIGKLPNTTAPTFDCRTAFNCVLPVDDQGNCGDCFGVSSADGCSMALIKAGVLPLDTSKGRLSSQYGLDCRKFDGGCGGGDEAQVIDEIKQNGFPLTSDYGPYTASSGRCKSGLTLYKIKDWGYCTPSQQGGVASTQDIKNAMVQYGPISVAFDASGCDSYRWPDVMTGNGRNVDHAVLCIGWDDSKQAFLGMNQWGDWGGPGGTFWIGYGSYSWGTEAIWIDGGAAPTPPPPPVPPVPPVPPTPPTPPTPSTVTLTLTEDQVASVITQSGVITISGDMTFRDYEAARQKALSQPKPPTAKVEKRNVWCIEITDTGVLSEAQCDCYYLRLKPDDPAVVSFKYDRAMDARGLKAPCLLIIQEDGKVSGGLQLPASPEEIKKCLNGK